MKLASAFPLICLATLSAFADNSNLVLTVGGETYSNVTFGASTPASLSIRHSTGVASIPFAKLPPEIQKQFGYDPQKAGEYLKSLAAAAKFAADQAEQERQRNAERQKQLADKAVNCNKHCTGKVLQVLSDGVLVEAGMESELGQLGGITHRNETLVWFVTPKYEGLVDGDWVDFDAIDGGSYEYVTAIGSKATVRHWRSCSLSRVGN